MFHAMLRHVSNPKYCSEDYRTTSQPIGGNDGNAAIIFFVLAYTYTPLSRTEERPGGNF